MGTRGTYGFRADGSDLLAYNHFDSYPGGLGVDILATARRVNPPEVRTMIKGVTRIDETDSPTQAQANDLNQRGILPSNVSTGRDWYAWLREYQGDPLGLLGIGYWPENNEFINDSLFCEWGYIINLDANELEVYEGFQTKGHSNGRYTEDFDPDKWNPTHRDTYYWPCALLTTFPLTHLPTDDGFLTQIEDARPDDEEML